jgi:hypothetical protein
MVTTVIAKADTEKRRKINARRVKIVTNKKNLATRLQIKVLDGLYLLACKAPDLKSLYVLRSSRETKVLTRQNYSKFIVLLDRLMESL